MKIFLSNPLNRLKTASLLTLLSSSSTLICCALPALLVTLGAGAMLSSLIAMVPQLVWFSVHKIGVFVLAGLMLIISGYIQWYARTLPCPTDLQLVHLCHNTRKRSLRIYGLSTVIYLVGVFFAFIAPWLNAS